MSKTVDLGSELSSEGYPKISDDRDIAEKAVSWTQLSAVKISGQSMKICGSYRIFASGGGTVTVPPPPSQVCVFAL